jgi:hypothetical protein
VSVHRRDRLSQGNPHHEYLSEPEWPNRRVGSR